MFCKNCGQQLSENDRFCPKCGWKIEKQVEQVKKSGGHKKKIICGLLMVVIVAVVGGVAAQVLKSDKNVDKTKKIAKEKEQEKEIEALYAMPYKGKWGWVNEEKEFVIEPEYEFALARSFENKETANVLEGDGFGGYKVGRMDRNGKMIIPIDEYRSIGEIENDEKNLRVSWYLGENIVKDVTAVAQGGNGMEPAEAGGQFRAGLINDKGRLLTAKNYASIYRFDENGVAVVQDAETEKYGCINSSGKELVKCKYIDVRDIYDECLTQNGMIAVAIEDEYGEEKWGYINDMGEVMIDFLFDSAELFSENGLACVGIEKHNGEWKYGYINKNGEIVIDFSFDSAGDFSENGLAYVGMEDHNEECKYGYINEKGKIVIATEFDNAYGFSGNGLAEVCNEEGLWGFIDDKGNVVIDFKYEYTSGFSENGLAWISFDEENWRMIDEQGNYVSEKQYDGFDSGEYMLGSAYENLYVVHKDGYYGIVDENGQELVPCEYSEVSMAKDKIIVEKEFPKGNKVQYGIRNLDGSWFMKMTEDNWYTDVAKIELGSWFRE